MGVSSLHEISIWVWDGYALVENYEQEDFNPQNDNYRVIEKHNGVRKKNKIGMQMDQGAKWHMAHTSLWKGQILSVFKPYEYDFLGCLTKCFNLCENAQEILEYDIS